MIRKILFLAILSLLTLIPGIVGAMTYDRIDSPEFDITYLDRIAVLPFETPEGDEFEGGAVADRLATHLAQEGYLKMVERMQVEKVMGEGKFSRSDFADTNLAAQFGKMVGADAVIIGRIDSSYIESENYIYIRDSDKSWNIDSILGGDKKDDDSKKEGQKEESKERQQVRTLEKTGDVNIDTKIVDVETGRIIASKVAYHNWKKRGVDEEEISALPPKGEILEDCVAQCMNILIRAYTPHKVTIERELRPKSHANADEMKAKYLAESGFYQDSIDIFEMVVAKEPKKNDIRGNLAILYEAVGDFEKADYWLREALNYKFKTAHDLQTYRNSMLKAWFYAQKENLSKHTVMVLEVSGEKVYIGAGRDKLLKIGDRFTVCRETVIKHPVTGETMGSDRHEIAIVEIIEVQEKMSIAKIIEVLDDEIKIERLDTAMMVCVEPSP